MKLYAIRPIRVRGYVVPEGKEFEPDSDAHGKELIKAGLASDQAPAKPDAKTKKTAGK